jgi:hypothetical protein
MPLPTTKPKQPLRFVYPHENKNGNSEWKKIRKRRMTCREEKGGRKIRIKITTHRVNI